MKINYFSFGLRLYPFSQFGRICLVIAVYSTNLTYTLPAQSESLNRELLDSRNVGMNIFVLNSLISMSFGNRIVEVSFL